MVVIHFLLFEKWKWWQLPQVSTTNTGTVKKNQFREAVELCIRAAQFNTLPIEIYFRDFQLFSL